MRGAQFASCPEWRTPARPITAAMSAGNQIGADDQFAGIQRSQSTLVVVTGEDPATRKIFSGLRE